MTKEQLQLVRRTWAIFRSISPEAVGDVFYSKLFLDHPGLQKMFPREMNAQYQKLIDMLSTIVARLERTDELNDDLVAMAKRHIHYGVKPEHYRWIGDALLFTIENGLGDDWNDDVKNAWQLCYSKLADTMIKAAY